MDDALVLELTHRAFVTAMLVSGPILLAVLIIGVVVSILQAITQVQEATLTFLPKLLGAGLVLLVGGHWMLEQMVQLAATLLSDFSHLAH